MAFDPINIPALLAPISDAEPAGNSGIFEILDRLRADRKAIIQALAEDPSPREGEWDRIVSLACDTLKTKSKHLQVAIRLVEALTRRDGYAGLRDGLKFLHGYCEQCWDRMYPELDPSDPSVRADPFEYLNDMKAGALMPIFIKALPMVYSENGAYSWAEINARDPQSQDRKVTEAFLEKQKQVKKAIDQTPRKNCESTFNALKEAIDLLAATVLVLNEKIGRNDAPGMGELRESMGDCLRQITAILKDKGGPTPTEKEPTADTEQNPGEAEAEADAEETGAMSPMKKTLTRADVYQRLAEAATLLEKMEPHSPIPYMIQRAVSLGSLSFPQLMKALITDAKTIEELNKGLGITEVK